MKDKIKQIIEENSVEKHFLEYGKGIFATDDAVNEMVKDISKITEDYAKQQIEEYRNSIKEWLIGEDFEGLAERC